MNYTYILECADKSLYTGWTKDIDSRVKAHNEGRGSKYTRARLPVKPVYFESFELENDARKRAAAIKKLSRKEKLELIKGFNQKGE